MPMNLVGQLIDPVLQRDRIRVASRREWFEHGRDTIQQIHYDHADHVRYIWSNVCDTGFDSFLALNRFSDRSNENLSGSWLGFWFN